MDSILTTIKKLLGIDEEDTSFDTDITIHINSVIPALSQMGIGPINGFVVTSKDDKWTDYITVSSVNLESVKTYIYLKVKLIFDPPTNSITVEAFKSNAAELEWRMMRTVETNNWEG